MNDMMKSALIAGRYESLESSAIDQHLRIDDRVLELGTGAGYLTMQIANRVGAQNVLTVEPHSKMIPVIEGNLAENGIEGVTVINAAAVPDSFTGEYVTFHITAAFWASSLHPAIAGKFKSTKSVEVPAVTISELMVEHKPSVVVMDIEGSERDLFEAAWPAHVRLLVIELHPRIYSDRTIKQIFDQMSASGLTYCPVGSRGNVVVFRRVTDST
ncbi:MAG: FkbM family methyltransferase [Marinosulfonomonas sp.]|nr:FkbM family methyltransferase [Marinosulfonomonas sp.]